MRERVVQKFRISILKMAGMGDITALLGAILHIILVIVVLINSNGSKLFRPMKP